MTFCEAVLKAATAVWTAPVNMVPEKFWADVPSLVVRLDDDDDTFEAMAVETWRRTKPEPEVCLTIAPRDSFGG